jgi:hypothetical protein
MAPMVPAVDVKSPHAKLGELAGALGEIRIFVLIISGYGRTFSCNYRHLAAYRLIAMFDAGLRI